MRFPMLCVALIAAALRCRPSGLAVSWYDRSSGEL